MIIMSTLPCTLAPGVLSHLAENRHHVVMETDGSSKFIRVTGSIRMENSGSAARREVNKR